MKVIAKLRRVERCGPECHLSPLSLHATPRDSHQGLGLFLSLLPDTMPLFEQGGLETFRLVGIQGGDRGRTAGRPQTPTPA